MPTITDVPPAVVSSELKAFRQHLDTLLPPKKEGGNLLIATWNIRAFASVNKVGTEAQAGLGISPEATVLADEPGE